MSKIKTLYFGVTNKCNFNCKYCYATPDRKSPEMSLDEIENFLIPWIKNGGYSIISFDGGEPLADLDRLIAIMKIIQDKTNIDEFQFITNGSLISEKILNNLERVSQNILFSVSVDTVDPGLDLRNPKSLLKVLENVEFLNKRGKLLGVLSTVAIDGLERTNGLFKHFENKNILVYADVMLPHAKEHESYSIPLDELKKIDRLMFKYAFNPAFFSSPTTIDPEVWTEYKPLLEYAGLSQYFGCTMFRYDNCIRPNGDIKPCQICNVVLGNVKTMTYSQLMQQDWVKRIMNLDVKGKCGTCVYNDSCHGGCRARAFVESGDYFGEIHSCNIDTSTKRHVDENLLTKRFEDAIHNILNDYL
ncbi:MAG: radical SAM protein [Candidatus Hodarchaeales archaeon]|jgi:radical SAM protein with 4Fe4S-binding SPASM domain